MAAGTRGKRRAPRRRGRRSAGRGLVALASAFVVVGTGIGIAWATHSFSGDDAAAAPNGTLSTLGGGGSTVASPAGAHASASASAILGAPISGTSLKPVQTEPGGAAPVPTNPNVTPFVKPNLNLPHATGPGTVQQLSVPSADTDLKSRDVWVYRPAVPAGTVLPVVYLLHGLPGEGSTMIDTVRAGLDEAFTSGGYAPFVVAGPTGAGNDHNDTEWADAADNGDLVETYLIKNVIPAVEGTTPLPANERAIVGFSMGGYGAVNIALRHPDLFGQMVSLSGYFHIDDPTGVFAGDRVRESANTPDFMVKQAAGKRVLLLEDQDETDALISGQTAEFAQRLHDCECGVDLNWKVTPGGHTLQYVSDSFPQVISFLDAGF